MRVGVAICAACVLIVGGSWPIRPAGAREARGASVIFVPPGSFVQGSDDDGVRGGYLLCLYHRDPGVPGTCADEGLTHEQPSRRVWVSRFALDRFEVTFAEYDRCVVEGACSPGHLSSYDLRSAGPDHPVAGVTFVQAAQYCGYVGGRLPTEAEWERAAKGATRRRFPWGDAYNDRLANHGTYGERPDDVDGHRYTAPVGSYPSSTSPFGVLDMAGNVWEWTADRYAPDAYLRGLRVDPRGPSDGPDRVVRGGSWRSAPHTLRTTHRAYRPELAAFPDVGFRCAYDGMPAGVLRGPATP